MSAPDLRRLTRAFVDLADTMVDEFDVIELLQAMVGHCAELLDLDAAGVMLADDRGQLHVAAASNERARLLELFELQNQEGPCLDCFRDGQRVGHSDLSDGASPWPSFAQRATADGFASVLAIPMRLRRDVIGALHLFRTWPSVFSDDDARVAQGFADIATIGILQERLVRDRELLATQLQAALQSRVILEQAKGVLAERMGVDMDTAFNTLRDAARRRSMLLSELAREVVARRGGGELFPD